MKKSWTILAWLHTSLSDRQRVNSEWKRKIRPESFAVPITPYFDGKTTLADCKPRLIHGFYDYLREDGDSEQTILHYHNLLHTAFEYAIRQFAEKE